MFHCECKKSIVGLLIKRNEGLMFCSIPDNFRFKEWINMQSHEKKNHLLLYFLQLPLSKS